MYGPLRDLAPSEAEKLLDYLDKGGRFLVAVNYRIQDLTNLNRVLASYGISYDYGIVNERGLYYIAWDFGYELPDVEDHEITGPLVGYKDRNPVVMYTAMSISALDTRRRSAEITSLLPSSSSAFLRTDIDEYSFERMPDDIAGPLSLGMAVTDPSWIDPYWNRTSDTPPPQTRIVALGCANLLALAAQGFDANRDLFMNSITWLEDRPETISARSKSLFLLPMRLNLVQIIVFGALFIAVIPLAFFIAGFVTWLKRRHL
jgi:ABC-2 type transport system permease protein